MDSNVTMIKYKNWDCIIDIRPPYTVSRVGNIEYEETYDLLENLVEQEPIEVF